MIYPADFITRHGEPDNDTMMAIRHFDEPADSRVLEVGANQSHLSHVLYAAGFGVTGVDLLDFWDRSVDIPYRRVRGDFVALAERGELGSGYDAMVSTSALEHFGLKTYEGCPGGEDHDRLASEWMHRLLRDGGTAYVTVPFGMLFFTHGRDWRVYSRKALYERIVGKFTVEKTIYFKSGDCECVEIPDTKPPEVTEENAVKYIGNPPHLTVFLKMRKGHS